MLANSAEGAFACLPLRARAVRWHYLLLKYHDLLMVGLQRGNNSLSWVLIAGKSYMLAKGSSAGHKAVEAAQHCVTSYTCSKHRWIIDDGSLVRECAGMKP
jgi:hypothetical protein